MDLKGNSGFYCSSSSCMLFEASGDSEGDFDPKMGSGNSDEIARFDDDDDDDAMSCSYDRSEYSCNVDVDSEANNVNWGESNCDEDDHEEHDVMKKDEKDEKNGVFGTSYCDEDDDDDEDEILQEQNHHHKPLFVSFDSSQEFVDEREKNRLFWEACLAS